MRKQPSSEMCFVCGRNNSAGLKMCFHDNEVDTVVGIVTIPEHCQGYPEIVHGGILTAILDEVVGRCIMAGDHHRFMMTVNMQVQFRHPVLVGTRIKAEGKLLRLKSRIAKAQGKLYLPNGQVACEAELTMADMPTEIATPSRLSALKWTVDPD
jgi:uncharacterized protein (TIGR00369 family)